MKFIIPKKKIFNNLYLMCFVLVLFLTVFPSKTSAQAAPALSAAKASIKLDSTYNLKLNNNNLAVSWKCSNTSILTFRQTGNVGMLSKSVNELYQKLLSTIEHLKEEKDRVSEAEKQKVDFLRAASHELKTPVTALNAMLENMIMEVGKYKDYSTFLPLCKEQTEQLGKMISEILDASKLNAAISDEQAHEFDAVPYLTELCGQYELIAQANGKQFHLDLPQHFTVCIPPKMFAKALSNVLSNAISYTDSNGEISVYIDGRTLRVENECSPISEEHLNRIFEPFYRPDYARTRDDGGNGLGLYIVASILNALKCSYSFCPMENPLGMRFSIEL
ncbi:MAG: HAMP domain-containing sensor histidine kinase [Lachnospiraceae bacterium]|nr:HAMP domain-containing sensor histidine kinase [Lachnospiraceae bacterium]